MFSVLIFLSTGTKFKGNHLPLLRGSRRIRWYHRVPSAAFEATVNFVYPATFHIAWLVVTLPFQVEEHFKKKKRKENYTRLNPYC